MSHILFDDPRAQRWREQVAIGKTTLGLDAWAEGNAAPEGCICDPGDWSVRPIPSACGEFIDDKFGTCTNCEHDKECHQ